MIECNSRLAIVNFSFAIIDDFINSFAIKQSRPARCNSPLAAQFNVI